MDSGSRLSLYSTTPRFLMDRRATLEPRLLSHLGRLLPPSLETFFIKSPTLGILLHKRLPSLLGANRTLHGISRGSYLETTPERNGESITPLRLLLRLS